MRWHPQKGLVRTVTREQLHAIREAVHDILNKTTSSVFYFHIALSSFLGIHNNQIGGSIGAHVSGNPAISLRHYHCISSYPTIYSI
ncbi:hypothetical protein HanIR_Chr11g0547581 [Helianthus annuus]|nr:hypothetical protein HanIR_Chr11g0547581 [Helianthus annuus]